MTFLSPRRALRAPRSREVVRVLRSPLSLLPSGRGPRGWAVALLLSSACWWALLSGALGSPGGLGLMFAGGWTLSLLPIHSARWVRRAPATPQPSAPQPSAPQPEPPGGGVEAGGLQDPAEP